MTSAVLAGIFVPMCIALALATYKIRRARMTEFEKQTVDEFLRRALHPEGGYRFSGIEWADREDEDEPEVEEKPKKVRRDTFLPKTFKPPLVRLHCTGCLNNWDAWVSDEGDLEDPRDAHCACDKGGFVCMAEEE